MLPSPSVDAAVLDALRLRIAELEESNSRQAQVLQSNLKVRFSPEATVIDLLALELAHAAQVDAAVIAGLNVQQGRIWSLGCFVDGTIAPGFESSMAGSPWEELLAGGYAEAPSGTGKRAAPDRWVASVGLESLCAIPLRDSGRRVLGMIVLGSRRPGGARGKESLLQMAASRAVQELERGQSQTRLRTLFDSNMVGIVFWNSEGGISEANDAFLQTVRYSREDLRNGRIDWKELTPPEHADRDAHALEELRNRGTCTPYEKEYVRGDGTRVPVLVGGSRITPDPLGGVAFVLELSARRQAEQAVREADELNRQIISSIRDGLCVHDLNLRYVHFNHEMEVITGAPAADVIGKHPLEVFPILKEMGIYADLERSLRGETRISADLPYHPAGSEGTRWTSTQSSPLRDSSGKIVGVIAVIRDITELKGTEEALRQSEQKLAEALRLTQDRVTQLEEQVQTRNSFESLVGKSPSMQEVYRRLRLAAESDVTVLLTGESGTGKELAAAAVHALSQRQTRPFVAVNCSAIPEGVLESELFGHVKGAFTGAARDKVGLFQAAHGGTLFLDEVGDMSPMIQVKVLRALQERVIRRVGDDREIKVDVRLVTATNRNLAKQIERGALREDFYYRIRVFEIQLPTLRERPEDISLMVHHFVGEMSRATGKRIRSVEPEALKRLMEYPWPGNVRELKNALEHAFVTVTGDLLKISDFPMEIRLSTPLEEPRHRAGDPDERQRILDALQRTGGRKAEAARRLGISRVTLWHRMRMLGLDSPAEREKPENR